jgi:hypothetical protein
VNLSSILDDYRACLLYTSRFLFQIEYSSLSNLQAHVVICAVCCEDITTVSIDGNLAVNAFQFLMLTLNQEEDNIRIFFC